MAKSRGISDSTVTDVPVIIEKYLAERGDISPAMKRVLCKLYRGELHAGPQWTVIVNQRLTKPAD